MKKTNIIWFVRNGVLSFLLFLLIACGENSSPEGRMRIKLDDLHKEMIDSLQKQNAAILDSLSKIREDLRKLEDRK